MDVIKKNPKANNQQVWDEATAKAGRKHGFNRTSFDVACSIVRKKLGCRLYPPRPRKAATGRTAKRDRVAHTTELADLRHAHEFVIAVGDVQQARQLLKQLDGLQLS